MAVLTKDQTECNFSHLELAFVIGCQFFLFVTYFYFGQLPGKAYFSPVLILELPKHPATAAFLLFHVAFGCFFFRRLAWASIDPNSGARIFVSAISAAVMWQFATYDYNFFYNQAHYWDRLFIVILAALTYCHPMFVPLFTSFVIIVASQLHYPLPEVAWLWPDKRILFDALILFNAFLFLAAFRKTTTHMFLYPVLCMTAGIYFFAGVAKLSLGPHYYSWLLDNKLSNLFVSSYILGWFGFFSPETTVKIATHLKTIDLPSAIATLLIELSSIVILWSRKASCIVLSGFILLHFAIALGSGILFWMWCVYDLVLIVFVMKTGSSSSYRIYNRKLFVLSTVIIFFSDVYFRPIYFAWFDTRLTNFFTIYGTGVSGTVYELEPHFFAPYDITFCQSRFYYLIDEKVLVGTYGTSLDHYVSQRLDTAHPSDIDSLKTDYGHIFYDARLTTQFGSFLKQYINNAQTKGSKFVSLNYFGPPYHFGSAARKARYTFQEQLKKVDVYYEERFFDGKEIKTIRKKMVMEIPLEKG